jgi:hypothetical protein
LNNSKKSVKQKIKAAHRNFVLNVTALIARKGPDFYCPEKECYKISTDDVYTHQTIKTVEQMRIDQIFSFWARFRTYVASFSSNQASLVWDKFLESADYKNWEKRQNARIYAEIRTLFADPTVQNTDIFDQFDRTFIFNALRREDIIAEDE